MSNSYSQKMRTDYENFIAVCPICDFENIYNRKTDLKTIRYIDFMTVNCFNCHRSFNINYDCINSAYEYLIFDIAELKKQKRYMYCILNLAQALEVFLYHSIKVKLLLQPFKDGLITSIEGFNSLETRLDKNFEKFTFAPLKIIFFKIYLGVVSPLSEAEIITFIEESNKKHSQGSTDEIKKYIEEHSKISSDRRLIDLFSKLNFPKVHTIRNKVVHKYSYRPILQEVEECERETRDIVFRLSAILEIEDELHYLN